MNQFCTISTQSHLYKVNALAESLRNQDNDFVLHVLVVDSESEHAGPNCKYWKLQDLAGNKTAQVVISQYAENADKLRWCLKPVFLKFLLEQQKAERVIYLDNDLFFYSDYRFLFDLLKSHAFLLTPHYYKNSPQEGQNWLEANFRVGLFNAGFVGVNSRGLETLQWWADCCIYRCQKNSFRGLFDDQKYLDLIPVIEETALILRHKGCNVAGWNKELCQRQKVQDKVLIEGIFPIVFIHFNDTTIREIAAKRDELLIPYWRQYFDTLKKYKHDLTENAMVVPVSLIDRVKYKVWKIVTDLGV